MAIFQSCYTQYRLVKTIPIKLAPASWEPPNRFFSITLTLEKCMTVVRLLLLVVGVFNLAIGLKIVVTVFLHLNRDSGSKDQLIPEDSPMED